jgi:hypothetical protein
MDERRRDRVRVLDVAAALRVAVAVVVAVAAAVACGSSSGGAASDRGVGPTPEGRFGEPDGAVAGLFGDDSGGGTVGEAGAGDRACASSFVQAHALPLMLVFMFDRSDSMNDLESTDGGAKQSKWDACVSGLGAFFDDPSSAGIFASLQFFMLPDECNVDGYAAPQVPMTALPSPVFDQAFAATTASGETPTVPALQGALAFAAKTATANPDAKVGVVFVTDGEPNGCDSTIDKAAAAAASAWGDAGTGTPTYVIGIGKVKSLDAIAKGGGTGQAFIVSTSDPKQTAVDFRAALGAIRGSSLGCDYPIPPPPAGQTLDYGAVNVIFTPSAGSPGTLPYDRDCTTSGWRYDDVQNPTRIEICPTRCTAIASDPGGSIAVEFGCATVGNLR